MLRCSATVDGAALEAIDEVARRLGPVAESDDRVRFVYLFGSLSRGEVRPGSDVDLAVSLRPRGRLLDDARLHDRFAAALDRDDVDLLVLNHAPLWLQFRVVAGRVVFSRDERERVAFRSGWRRCSWTSGPTTTATWRLCGSAPAAGCSAVVDQARVDELLAGQCAPCNAAQNRADQRR